MAALPLHYLLRKGRTLPLLLAFLTVGSGLFVSSANSATFVQRAPISIVGNSTFTAANGVTGGDGSQSNPFIIDGWKIGYSGSPGIEIQNATAHFVIRNVYLNTTIVVFRNDTNGAFQASTIDDSKGGSYDTAFLVASSSSIMITGNNIQGGTALDIEHSSAITISGNSIGRLNVWGTFQGITINASSNITVQSNTVSALMGWALIVENDNSVKVSGNSVYANDCTGSGWCARSLYVVTSSNITITANNVTGITGIVTSSTNHILVYHNNIQAGSSDTQGTGNHWDNGYPSGGNFWFNYNGTDPDNDGIGDTPYLIPNSSFKDYYPLMKPFVASPIISVVVGTDGNLYSSTSRPDGSWNMWQSLSGSTPSTPTLCRSGPDRIELVVRGMDNVIYHKSNVNGTWSSVWDSLGGLTPSQPACAVLNGTLYVVVRGMSGGLYYQTESLQTDAKSGWIYLLGSSPSAPTLCVSGPTSLELLLRGDDNGLYHKTFSAGVWSSSWDKNPSGVIFDTPACGIIGSTLYVAVKGSGESLYATTFDLSSRSWASSWTDLQGSSSSTPELVSTQSLDRLDVVVVGMDRTVYHKSLVNGVWTSAWDSPRAVTNNVPAVVSDGSDLRIIVAGTDGSLVSSILSSSSSQWSGWAPMNGSTVSNPSAT